jgi:hypothetical protein
VAAVLVDTRDKLADPAQVVRDLLAVIPEPMLSHTVALAEVVQAQSEQTATQELA